MENEIKFAKWCFENHKYIYDSSLNLWFQTKSLRITTWEEMYEIYVKQLKK